MAPCRCFPATQLSAGNACSAHLNGCLCCPCTRTHQQHTQRLFFAAVPRSALRRQAPLPPSLAVSAACARQPPRSRSAAPFPAPGCCISRQLAGERVRVGVRGGWVAGHEAGQRATRRQRALVAHVRGSVSAPRGGARAHGCGHVRVWRGGRQLDESVASGQCAAVMGSRSRGIESCSVPRVQAREPFEHCGGWWWRTERNEGQGGRVIGVAFRNGSALQRKKFESCTVAAFEMAN